MYDKLRGTRKLLPIKQVAQQPNFYTDAVEKSLTEQVEKPANAVIDKLKRREIPDEVDRLHFTYYLGTMIRRTPHAREQAYKMVPKALADTASELKANFEAEARAGHLNPEALEKRLAEIDAAEKKFQQQPPSNTVELIETPWPMESTLVLLFTMTWRFLPSEGPSYFLTSDNPAYFFTAYGLGTDLAEFIFPICSNLALHCSWQENNGPGILPANQKMVKEFNRRIACGADRFIFYHQERDWVLNVAQNKTEHLSRIRWS